MVYIERYFDREEEEVDTDRCVQHRTMDRYRDSSIEIEEEEVDTDICVQHRTMDR
jgi:hypothetical protein